MARRSRGVPGWLAMAGSVAAAVTCFRSERRGPGLRSVYVRAGRGDDVGVISNFPSGSYRFLAAPGRPFSGGIVADPGFDLVHAVFQRPVPLAFGLSTAIRCVEAAGRPATALAAFELRIPEPLSRADFDAFNAPYVERMAELGLRSGDDLVTARTNVAPTVQAVAEPSLYAFTYTVPRSGRSGPAFRLSGATETRGGSPSERLRSIVEELEGRMAELGVSWDDATAVNVYGATGAPADDIVGSFGSAALHGISWFPSRPPIRDLDFEIDARGVGTEIVL
jgi:hypothetical protein